MEDKVGSQQKNTIGMTAIKYYNKESEMIKIGSTKDKYIYMIDNGINDDPLIQHIVYNYKLQLFKLPVEIQETINQLIYTYIFKNKVLNIDKPITMKRLYERDMENILIREKLREYYRNSNGNEVACDRIRNEESWVLVDVEEETSILNRVNHRNANWEEINKCNMNTKTGKKCRCVASLKLNIKNYGIYVKSLCNYKEDHYYDYDDRRILRDELNYECSIKFCKKHLKVNTRNYDEFKTIKKFYNDNGYDINKYGYCIKCK
tara:strand:- start:481 stop:1266 length:786 start_codon:yes stop_codon:yes gene_type:complete